MSTTIDYSVRKSIRAKLRRGIVNIFFRKADGRFRSMDCTLSPTLLGNVTTKPSAETVTVYDINENGWRTVRYDRIISYGYQGPVTNQLWLSGSVTNQSSSRSTRKRRATQ
jgi:hypothetical protein